jgi:endogenous inhibitor of DNA gyrase (YacG/DUF329 family)
MKAAGLNCPQCRQPTVWEGNDFRPFCSQRCRLLDLGAWAGESYRIPGQQVVPTSDNDDNIIEK